MSAFKAVDEFISGQNLRVKAKTLSVKDIICILTHEGHTKPNIYFKKLFNVLKYNKENQQIKIFVSIIRRKFLEEDQLEEFEKKEKEEKMEFFREEKRIIAKRKRNVS